MTISEGEPVYGLAELQAQPIFLGQFLRLPLQKINTFTAASAGGKTKPAYTPGELAHDVDPFSKIGSASQVQAWDGFVDEAKKMLQNLPSPEADQHILPPPAFRQGDLPLATMLPTVYLWTICQTWQPFNRVLSLDEEVGRSSSGHPLQIGDHLPRHFSDLSDPLPRQVIFREREKGIRGIVLVKEPWLVSLPDLFDGQQVKALDRSAEEPAQRALAELIYFLENTKTTFAVLTTYEHFVFVRRAGESIQLSPAVSATGRDMTVYTALWYWARQVANEQ